jgi:hypothetical protein
MASRTLADLVADLQRAHKRKRWDDFRACFHPEAKIESVAAGAVLGPAETVAAVESAIDDGVYAMSEWTIETLEPEVVLAWAGVRQRGRAHPKQISDGMVFWLVTGRDGLMWRVRTFRDRDAATAHLATHGHTLGL